MRLQWVVLLLLICSVFSTSLARAGEPFMTAEARKQGEVFSPYLRRAVAAAEQGDRATTQMQLRDGLRTSGYGLRLRDDVFSTFRTLVEGVRIGCAGPTLPPLPVWVLAAQVAIGDVAGAEETARSQTSAFKSLAAFWVISEVQAGDSRTLDTIKNKSWMEKEWSFDKARYIQGTHSTDTTKIDTASLKRLASTGIDWEGARQTLRKALPYARAIRSDARPLFLLSCRQMQLGDLVGSLTTAAYLMGNPSFYVVLFFMAGASFLCLRIYRQHTANRYRRLKDEL